MYLGNQPALSYTSFAKQDFTTSATTSYTLDNPVANANELALFINFVRQEPTTAYTASGTTLTLTSATSASDDMYCVFLGKAIQTVNPPNGSVGASQLVDGSIALGKLSATGTKDSTTFLRGDNTFATAGGTNTPAFRAKRTTNLTINNGTNTIVTFDTEEFDVGSNYDTSNGKFTPTTAGKYFLYCKLKVALGTGIVYMEFRKNGSNVHSNYENVGSRASGDYGLQLSTIQSANGSSDYFEVNYYQGSGSSKTLYGGSDSSFMGYKIIE